ncbi:MAG TPA: LytTR family DNA-binding domain-containing protein [Puia sp.]|jgi:DNA-binding LytR/AlgR family response regulator|nr:LytTR family DNA-binding domain-containing protein [Puia sp.]
MINAIALDDELPALKILENFCGKTELVRLEATFIRPGEALAYLRQNPVDLLFLDINMPSQTGIEFYGSLKPGTMAIFTTAYSEYAVEGFNLNAIDYLLKPFTFQRFLQAVDKAVEYFGHRQKKDAGYLFLRIDYSLVKIEIAAIRFIEGMDDYLKIHLQNKPPVMVRMTMKSILSQLPDQQFIRVHRSYIIAVSRILNIRNKVIYLEEKEIPIGISYEKDFFTRFSK